jgi:biotin transport system substrate-specific component
MNGTMIKDNLLSARLAVFMWRYTLSIPQKCVLALAMACLTGALAQLKIFLPWTPVPITGQTVIFLLSGVVLGTWWGGVSQLIYVIAGCMGLQWFADGASGWHMLVGPRGGYLLGFILVALFIGYVIEAFPVFRRFYALMGLLFVSNLVFIYGAGLVQLGAWLRVVQHVDVSLMQLLTMGFWPFLLGDTIKVVVASIIARGVLPRE